MTTKKDEFIDILKIDVEGWEWEDQGRILKDFTKLRGKSLSLPAPGYSIMDPL